MNRFFYTTAIRALSPLLMLYMGLRARRAGGQWQVCSKARFALFGSAVRPRAGAVWVHAVSLGETRAAEPLIRALLSQGERVLLTHMTVTGREEGARAFAAHIASGQLEQQWLPYDFPGATRRFFEHYRLSAGILIEREVWPNLMAAGVKAGVPLMLASARLSDQALRSSIRMGSVMREAYRSFKVVYAQTLQDAHRLEHAGARGVRVSGNLKFDVNLPDEKITRGRHFAQNLARRIIVIASTREGEDEMFAEAIERYTRKTHEAAAALHEPVLFVVVPRHPQRFETLEHILQQRQLSYVKRSTLLSLGDGSTPALEACQKVDVLLGDTLGEMHWYYALAKVAIVAGSFAPLGGQNFIEASAVGVPVIVGPHTRHFEQAVHDAVEAEAVLRANNAANAVQLALDLLDQPTRLHYLSDSALHWVQMHTGAVLRVIAGLNEIKLK